MTADAFEGPEVESDFIERPAIAALLSGVSSWDADHHRPRLDGLVLCEPHELAPASVLYRLRQLPVPDHVPDSEVLESDEAVLPHEPRRELVVKVEALAPDTGVLRRDPLARLESVLGAILFAR